VSANYTETLRMFAMDLAMVGLRPMDLPERVNG
jgi:hypothetical protein